MSRAPEPNAQPGDAGNGGKDMADPVPDTLHELPILMALRVRGRARPVDVVTATGVSGRDVRAALARARARGDAVSDAGGAWRLTPSGAATLRVLLAAEAIDREALAAHYERFLTADANLKAEITAWQLGEPAPGRDTPLGHVGARVARDDRPSAALGAVERSARAAEAVARLIAGAAPRYGAYADRVAAGVAAIATGDTRFIASARVDSLHQAWFELHEDLLVTLDRPRRT